MRPSPPSFHVLLVLLCVVACADPESAEDTAPSTAGVEAAVVQGEPDGPVTSVVIRERWVSASHLPADTVDLDSPQVWVSPEGQGWVIVTAKEGDQLHVLRADDGTEVRRVGREGTGPGEMDRPNGIAIWEDRVLLVERDNARVQLFSLPDFEPLGSFGQGELTYPYGIATVEGSAPDELRVWITDDYPVDSMAPDYTRRVHEYRLRVAADGPRATHVGSFGDGEGPRRLEVVETIWADADQGVLLIADESARAHRVFDFDGSYTGQTVAEGLIAGDPEGVALYRCGDEGYWILTDQRDDTSLFLVLDRSTFRHLGTFRGEVTANTDGIGLTQAPVLSQGGALFALHDDQAVSAFAWADVARALSLQVCPDGGESSS